MGVSRHVVVADINIEGATRVADAIVGSWDLGMRNRPVYTWLSGFRLKRFFTAVH